MSLLLRSRSVIWLRTEAIREMKVEAQRMTPLETGGVLLGYQAGGSYVVTRSVGPGPDAVHEEDGFLPDHEYHEREVADHYRTSGRTEVYLGDWHTHPTASAYLSVTDLETLRRISRFKASRIAEPIMLVWGRDEEWRLSGWQHRPSLLSSLRLSRGVQRCFIKYFDQ